MKTVDKKFNIYFTRLTPFRISRLNSEWYSSPRFTHGPTRAATRKHIKVGQNYFREERTFGGSKKY